jgi:glycosyltransferase involved in cell wall biosynthesis
VIDGNSTDGTQQVLEHYSNSLAYWHSQKDQGQYDAINQGFAKSTGELMTWLNADDMLLPNSLFVVAEVFGQLAEVEWISSLQPASWDANGYLAQVNSLPGFNRQAFCFLFSIGTQPFFHEYVTELAPRPPFPISCAQWRN